MSNDNLAVIDGIIMNVRYIRPEEYQKQVLKHFHSNNMGDGKTKLLTCESIY